MAKKKEKSKMILVVIPEDSFGKIFNDARVQNMCYGEVTMADTVAMLKILTAVALGKEIVEI